MMLKLKDYKHFRVGDLVQQRNKNSRHDYGIGIIVRDKGVLLYEVFWQKKGYIYLDWSYRLEKIGDFVGEK